MKKFNLYVQYILTIKSHSKLLANVMGVLAEDTYVFSLIVLSL